MQNKLLKENDGKRLDTGTTGTVGQADLAMATLGTIDRTEAGKTMVLQNAYNGGNWRLLRKLSSALREQSRRLV